MDHDISKARDSESMGLRVLARQVDGQDDRINKVENNVAELKGSVNTLSVQMTTIIEKMTQSLDRLSKQEELARATEKDSLKQELKIAKEYVSIERCQNCSLRVGLQGGQDARKELLDFFGKVGPMAMVIIAALIAMYVSISSQQAVQEALRKLTVP